MKPESHRRIRRQALTIIGMTIMSVGMVAAVGNIVLWAMGFVDLSRVIPIGYGAVFVGGLVRSMFDDEID